MRCLVINCSPPRYNLGARKLVDWLRAQDHQVTYTDNREIDLSGYDLVCLSVIFSWDALAARDIALQAKASAEVWCGGPGMLLLARWWKKETGLECVQGLDWRFERQRGDYQATFASRGCPKNCYFCLVPRLEGSEFTLDWDFSPAPILCDNNLSALPVEFQNHIINRYQTAGTPLLDANSGFEPATFDEATYRRWQPILRGPWRLALDEQRELDDVRRTMHILRGERTRLKRVYVLIGNEPITACYERAVKVIECGGEPFVQPLIPLNALSKTPKVAYDWTAQRLADFAKYFNRYVWRSASLAEYRPRKNQEPEFKDVSLGRKWFGPLTRSERIFVAPEELTKAKVTLISPPYAGRESDFAYTLMRLADRLVAFETIADQPKKGWPEGTSFYFRRRKQHRLRVKSPLDVEAVLQGIARSTQPAVQEIVQAAGGPYDKQVGDPGRYARRLRIQARQYLLNKRGVVPRSPAEMSAENSLIEVLPVFDDLWARAIRAWDARVQNLPRTGDIDLASSRKLIKAEAKLVVLAWLGDHIDRQAYERHIRRKYNKPAPLVDAFVNSQFSFIHNGSDGS